MLDTDSTINVEDFCNRAIVRMDNGLPNRNYILVLVGLVEFLQLI